MSFTDAIKSVFSHYATFSGRARRSEYWWWSLFAGLVGIVLETPFLITHKPAFGMIYALWALATLLPNLALISRRLHDTGRSFWWVWISLVPLVGAIVLLVFFVTDSQSDNKYGPSPKHPGSPAPLADAPVQA